MKGGQNRVRLTTLSLALLLASGCRNTTSVSDLKPSTSRAAYADTGRGFRAFINELLEAHARATNVQSRMRSLVIPNSSDWFIRVFGPTSGPILDFQYRHQLGWQFGRLYAYLPIYARGQNHLVHTEHCEQGHLSTFVTNSPLIPLAEQPLNIYSASIATQEEGPWMKVGSFVYVGGHFRFMGWLEIEPNWGEFYSGYNKPFEN